VSTVQNEVIRLIGCHRIEKYTSGGATEPLSSSLVNNSQLFSPPNQTVPTSPTASMKTNPSALNLGERIAPFPSLANSGGPSQSPRMNPTYSATDIASLSGGTASNPLGLRSSSMIFMPGAGSMAQPSPQPSLDGFEPRMFPGVVSRRTRKNSTRSGDDHVTMAPVSPSWSRKAGIDSQGIVTEEPDDVDSDDE